MTARCTGCGSSLSDDATACDQCGGAVTRAAPAQPSQQSHPQPVPGPADAGQDAYETQRPSASSVSTARPEPAGGQPQVGRAATFQLPAVNLRSKKLWVVAVAAVLVVVLGAVVVVQTVGGEEGEARSPEETVQAFFDALRERDAKRALAQVQYEGTEFLRGKQPSADLLSDRALESKWYQPPKNVEVGTANLDDEGGATVNVTYTVAGEQVTRGLRLYPDSDGDDSGEPKRWELGRWAEDGVTDMLYLRQTAEKFEINQVTIAADKYSYGDGRVEWVYILAFPGRYRVGVPSNPLYTAEAKRVGLFTNGKGKQLHLPTTLKEPGVGEVKRQVNAFVDKCAAQDVLEPEVGGRECPFSSFGGIEGADEDQQLITWTVKRYPKVDVTLQSRQDGGPWAVFAGGLESQGIVELKYQAKDAFTGKTVHPEQTQRFRLEGPISVGSKSLRFKAD